MKRIIMVFRRDYGEMRATAAFRIMVIVAAVITAGASIGISVGMRLQSWYGEPESAPVLDVIMGLVVYFLPLVVLVAFIWAFASYPVVREKVNGNIECLMATPLSPGELLAGKGLAVFIPGYVISLVTLGVIMAAVNLAVFIPGWNAPVVPWPALVLGIIINPGLFLALLLVTLILSLVHNPDAAVAPSLLIGFGLMIGMPVGLTTGTFDITSWLFLLWYLAGTMLFWLATFCLLRTFTRQKIVLSSRGS